ncbi:MAG: type I pullulanase, partial [Bacteroides sp.]|nr:type I pullulanase [Bacteroides sp.]
MGIVVALLTGCGPKKMKYTSYEEYPVRSDNLIEMEYKPDVTTFTLWTPTADEVRLMLYDAGDGGHAYETIPMERSEEGKWTIKVPKNLKGK